MFNLLIGLSGNNGNKMGIIKTNHLKNETQERYIIPLINSKSFLNRLYDRSNKKECVCVHHSLSVQSNYYTSVAVNYQP